MKSISQRQLHTSAVNLAIGALLAALIFCGTYYIKLPMPAGEGYIHAGDGFVFLAAVLLPAPYAAAAAAIGAGLSDLIGGYPVYIPVTVAVRVAAVFLFTRKRIYCIKNYIALASAAVINVVGYWAFESLFIYRNAVGGIASMPFNLAQSVLGAIIFLMLAHPAAAAARRVPGKGNVDRKQ